MSLFAALVEQHAIADRAFAVLETEAFTKNDEAAFDLAGLQRGRNERVYFLYLFTRFEEAVNEGVQKMLAARCSPAVAWEARRIWETMRKSRLDDVAFLTRVQVLIDKSKPDYAYIVTLFKSRNGIGHGGDWEQPYVVSDVAARLDTIVRSFALL